MKAEGRMKRMRPLPQILFCLLPSAFCLLLGCKVGPNYRPPNTHVASSWHVQKPEPTTMSTTLPVADRSVTSEVPLEVTQWWMGFNDPELNTLITRAVASNLDLRIVSDRLRQARASRAITAAGLYPTVNSNARYDRSHSRGSGSPPDSSTDFFQGGFDASWEVDIFGGLRRSIEAADANYGAAIEDRRDALVTLLAEVAIDYIDLRSSQREIAIARANLDVQLRTQEVTRLRIVGGFAASLDVANSEAVVASTAAQLPVLETSVSQSIYALSVLLGQEPEALEAELQIDAPVPTTPPEVPIGLPSDLLRRRPDVRRAERQLAAATANIGVATAQLFPAFSLTGNLGLQNQKFSNAFDLTSRYWSVGPSVSWPIFDFGRLRANIDVQNAVQREALSVYQRTVLIALQDVKSALVAYAKEQVHRKALKDAVAQIGVRWIYRVVCTSRVSRIF